MAELFQHGRTLARFIQRWRVVGRQGSRARISEVPSWVTPTVRIDRDYDVDERQIWAYTADAVNNSLATNFPAVAIFAGAREVHIRKIDFWIDDDLGVATQRLTANVLTPPSGYNSVQFNSGEFFPFLQTTPTVGVTAPLSLPDAIVIGGHQTGLMIVTIGGVPVNPAIGPRYRNLLGNLTFAVLDPETQTILDWSDPPLILPPFRQFAVQFINPVAGRPMRLFVNYFISEREAA